MAAPAAVTASPTVKPASKYVKTAHETVALPAAKTANSAAFDETVCLPLTNYLKFSTFITLEK